MTPKEKAEELLEEMTFRCIECHYQDNARRCAIIAVNEIISVIENGNPIESQYNYWNEVKKELIKYQPEVQGNEDSKVRNATKALNRRLAQQESGYILKINLKNII